MNSQDRPRSFPKEPPAAGGFACRRRMASVAPRSAAPTMTRRTPRFGRKPLERSETCERQPHLRSSRTHTVKILGKSLLSSWRCPRRSSGPPQANRVVIHDQLAGDLPRRDCGTATGTTWTDCGDTVGLRRRQSRLRRHISGRNVRATPQGLKARRRSFDRPIVDSVTQRRPLVDSSLSMAVNRGHRHAVRRGRVGRWIWA